MTDPREVCPKMSFRTSVAACAVQSLSKWFTQDTMFNITKSYCSKKYTPWKNYRIFTSRPLCLSQCPRSNDKCCHWPQIYIHVSHPIHTLQQCAHHNKRSLFHATTELLHVHLLTLQTLIFWSFINHLVLIQPPPARLFRGSESALQLTPTNPYSNKPGPCQPCRQRLLQNDINSPSFNSSQKGTEMKRLGSQEFRRTWQHY